MARLKRMSGAVTVREGTADVRTVAQVGQALYAGDVITTGKGGGALLTFAGGNVVELSAATSLVLGDTGATAAQVGAVLTEGVARAVSGAQGVVLRIGTPVGVTEVGIGEVDLAMSAKDGIRVLVGEIEVVTEAGTRAKVTSGHTLSVDGLVVPVGFGVEGFTFPLTGGVGDAPPAEAEQVDAAEPITLEPMSVVLHSKSKDARVKRAGTSSWKRSRKGMELKEGDAVRTRRAGAVVQLGDGGSVTMRPNSQLELGETVQSAQQQQAALSLQSGGAVLALEAQEGKKIEHTLELGGLTVKVRPGVREGNVDVVTNKKGRARVVVRSGQAELADGQIIEAGRAVELQKGKLVSPDAPLARARVTLKPRTSALVYLPGKDAAPAMGFMWPRGARQQTYSFELATDRQFQKLLTQETFRNTSFTHDRLRMAQYYWRVQLDGEWARGLFALMAEDSTDCAKCKRNNTIEDTGEKTVVYYQQTLPAIRLRWKSTPAADAYRLQVFADGQFDDALVDERIRATEKSFRAGALAEGKYYWLVTAFDGQGADLAAGRMNSLEIAYDNVVTALVIKAPAHGSRLAGRTVKTTGEVELGSRLYVNGRAADVEENGRFSEAISLQRGANDLVYRLLGKDGVERYYFRTVHRR